MSQCCWENEVDRFAQCRVATKFQVVKNAIFAKCNNCSHEIKTLTPQKENYDQPRQHIKK